MPPTDGWQHLDGVLDVDQTPAQGPPQKLARTRRRGETARVLRGFLEGRAVN